MISEIQNGETGASVRGKLNQAIASINSLNDNADSFLFGSTPPASRRDGSPLQVGDRLTEPNGSSWFFNGTYWLSSEKHFLGGNASISSLSGTAIIMGFALPESPVFFESLTYQRQGGVFSGTLNANNRFDLGIDFQAQTISAGTIDTVDLLHNPQPISFPINATLGYAFGYPGGLCYIVTTNIVGSPAISSTGSNLQFGIYWRNLL